MVRDAPGAHVVLDLHGHAGQGGRVAVRDAPVGLAGLLKRLVRRHRHKRADAAVDLVDTVENGAGQLVGRDLASIQESLRGVRGEPHDIGRVHVRL